MHSPYTANPADAFVIAHTSIGLCLCSTLLLRPLRSRLGEIALGLAILAVTLAPTTLEFLPRIGRPVANGHDLFLTILSVASALAVIGVFLSGRIFASVFALGSYGALYKLSRFVLDSDFELAQLHLAFFAACIALAAPPLSDTPGEPTSDAPFVRRGMGRDLGLFFVTFVSALLVSHYVLQGRIDSSDEWANTFQAAAFAKGMAYAPLPDCAEAYQNFWVFHRDGRMFSQYTPGFPLFMAPFVRAGVPMLAGPASLGFLAVGLSRLTERLAHASFLRRQASLAGVVAALSGTLGASVLLNGASRYPHVLVAALFVWAIEALAELNREPRSPSSRWGVGLMFGLLVAGIGATRPADGALLSLGLAVGFVYGVATRRIGFRVVAASAFGFFVGASVTLVILRLQLGVWGETGYSLAPVFHPWAKFGFSIPRPNEWKWGVPLATGAYMALPASVPLGVLGLLRLGPRVRWVGVTFASAAIPFVAFYTIFEMGRGFDWGYGPRYALPMIVPLAVGTGLLVARLAAGVSVGARRVKLATALPLGITVGALVVGPVRVAPLIYSNAFDSVQRLNGVFMEIERQGVTNAVVFLAHGQFPNEGLDLTQNYPVSLYRNQNVIVARELSPAVVQCVKQSFPERAWYRARSSPFRVERLAQ